jgi:hypothetical protein
MFLNFDQNFIIKIYIMIQVKLKKLKLKFKKNTNLYNFLFYLIKIERICFINFLIFFI